MTIGLALFAVLYILSAGCSFSAEPGNWLQARRATHLIGLRIQNEDGQELGTLNNFIVDLRTGQAPYAVVSEGGLFGLGAKLRVVPTRLLSSATSLKDILALSVTSKHWQHAPVLRGNLIRLASPEEARRIDAFYALPPPSKGESTGSTGRTATANREEGAVKLATDLIGRYVYDSKLTWAGRIADFVIDLNGSKPILMLVSRGHLWARKETFVVPLPRVTLAKGSAVALKIKKENFRNAPEFDQAALMGNPGPVYRLTATAASGGERVRRRR